MFCFVKLCKALFYLADYVSYKKKKAFFSFLLPDNFMNSHTLPLKTKRNRSRAFVCKAVSSFVLILAFFSPTVANKSENTLFGSVSASNGNFADLYAITAGPANVCGRVKVRKGRAISGATLIAVGGRGDTYMTRTATFGYYCFIGLSAGETYIISVSARGFYFPEPNEVIIPFEDVYGLDFEAL